MSTWEALMPFPYFAILPMTNYISERIKFLEGVTIVISTLHHQKFMKLKYFSGKRNFLKKSGNLVMAKLWEHFYNIQNKTIKHDVLSCNVYTLLLLLKDILYTHNCKRGGGGGGEKETVKE